MATLIVLRFFCGVFGSSGPALGVATCADVSIGATSPRAALTHAVQVWAPHERGRPVSLYAIGPMVSVVASRRAGVTSRIPLLIVSGRSCSRVYARLLDPFWWMALALLDHHRPRSAQHCSPDDWRVRNERRVSRDRPDPTFCRQWRPPHDSAETVTDQSQRHREEIDVSSPTPHLQSHKPGAKTLTVPLDPRPRLDGGYGFGRRREASFRSGILSPTKTVVHQSGMRDL